MNTIDPTLCPICHEPNVCAMEKAKATGTKPERCWCMDAVFTPALIDLVPDQAKGWDAMQQDVATDQEHRSCAQGDHIRQATMALTTTPHAQLSLSHGHGVNQCQ